jgi:hypothetical protein
MTITPYVESAELATRFVKVGVRLPPTVVRDEAAARAWMEHLADLYTSWDRL